MSDIACTGCKSGYTLPEGLNQGRCIGCESPCVTCIGTSTYCTSCVSGFTKKGWKCQKDVYVGFNIVFGGDV